CAVRSSVIMGFVGGGGLGQQMEMSMKMLAGGEVFTMLAVFVALVALADLVSRRLRSRMEHDQPAGRTRLGWPLVLAALTVASFASLDLRLRELFAADGIAKM